MKKFRLLMLLLMIIFLASCNSKVTDGGFHSTESPMQPGIVEETPPADESQGANENDRHGPPWPDPISVEADLNGDGVNDTVELYSKNHDYERYVRTTVAGQEYEVFIANLTVEDERLTQLFAIDGDMNGRQEVALSIYTNGSGGGNILFVLDFTNNQLGFIELPRMNPGPDYFEEENGSRGFNLQVELLDGYRARVYSPYTKQEWLFSFDMSNEDTAMALELAYGQNGKVIADRSFAGVDSAIKISDAAWDGRPCIEVVQYIWGAHHLNGIGYLITAFAWKDGRYVILEQKCVPYADGISLYSGLQKES